MIINKTSMYKRDLKQKVINKHLIKELNRINNIEMFIISKKNMDDLMHDPMRLIYRIEKKSADLKEYYTAHVNDKIRLYIKPIGKYPYNLVEIDSIEFTKIDDKHYGEG